VAAGAIVLVAVCLIATGWMAQNEVERRFQDATISGKSVLWQKIVSGQLDHMSSGTTALTRDRDTLAALKDARPAELARNAVTTYNLLSASGVITKLQIMDAEGRVLFSHPREFSGVTGKTLAQQALREGRVIRGIERDDDGELVATVSFPLYERGKRIGVGVFARDLKAAIEDFKSNDQSDAYVLSLDRKLEYATDAALYESLGRQTLPPAAERRFDAVSIGDKTYALVVQPVTDPQGKPLAHLLSVKDYTDSYHRQQWITRIAHVAALLLLAAALAGLYWYLRRSFTPLSTTVEVMGRIANGQYDNEIVVGVRDEVGKLLDSLKVMQAKLGDNVAELRNSAAEVARVKTALDNARTSVMVVASGGRVIYVNRAMQEAFGRVAGALRTLVPDFDAGAMVGMSVERLFAGRADLRELALGSSQSRESRFEIAGHTFVIAAAVVADEHGERLGTCLEWTDVTEELNAQEEINGVVQAALHGDLSRRIPLKGKEGFVRTLGEGVNRLAETIDEALEDIARVLDALAHGDLTQTVSREYAGTFEKVRNDINATVGRLTEVVSRIKDSTGLIQTAAREIANGNTDLSARTEEQATSLEETASSMEELTSTVKHNADNARQANEIASDAYERAMRGAEVVSRAVGAMGDISSSSRKIAAIIGVIDEIAFQTNLLALNAAVEAARAGEQGRGFAVVATEVRNLASRSAAAAKEIKGLIQHSVEQVQQGENLVEESGEALAEIQGWVRKVKDIVAEISTASHEQSAGIEQVNKVVTQMDQTTQQNAALVEQAAAASKSLEDQAQAFAGLMAFFSLGEERAEAAQHDMDATRREGAAELQPAVEHCEQQLNFARARQAHLSWLMRLRTYLEKGEGISREQVVSHHHCELGKWIDGVGHESYAAQAVFQTLDRRHADFHELVRRIVEASEDGKREEAAALFAQIKPLSQELLRLLGSVEAEVAASNEPAPSRAAQPRPRKRVAAGGGVVGEEWEEF
jgi:methyl-accepting chemotaxis protein